MPEEKAEIALAPSDEPTVEIDTIDKGDADIHRLSFNGKDIILIGTAHVSRKSAETVERVILNEKPDTVCVELCDSRMIAIRKPDSWREMDIVKVIREKKVFLLLSHLLLAAFQKRIAKNLDVKAGEEMLRAVITAENQGALVVPADREIRTTLSRAWRLLGYKSKFKLLLQLIGGLSEADDITAEDIEALKEKDALELLLKEMGDIMPDLRRVLIDERDLYLAEKIRTAPGEKIVAVVGAGHVPGITKNWEEPIDLAALDVMPPKGRLGAILGWGIPGAIVALIVGGFFFMGKDTGLNMAMAWALVTGVLAGIGAIAAWAHPLSILTAVVAAPVATIHPAVATGWAAGLVEAWVRKPQVKDLESISDDIMSFSGFWRNKVTRILLVVAFTNAGAMLGTLIAIPLLARMFGK
ncbi:MAG: TraB/GumN family protein [Deltaproteobacteria bacterium]|nr:TraB/GumN family protein [Deltaproteobacteria bacterium]